MLFRAVSSRAMGATTVRKILWLPLLMTTLSGCFIAPAMQMDEAAAVKRGREKTGNKSFKILSIDSELLNRLALESLPAPHARDPLGADALAYEYRIAPFDVLMVTVWDHPELTTPTGQFRSPEENGNRVSADGTIFYPFVGVVQVADKTVSEVRKILADRLARVITNPQLDVRVAAFRGKRAQVTGEVVQPSTIPITDVPLRVQDAIATARGFTPEADWANVSLSRDGKLYKLNLQALYENGDLSQNWLIKDGDVINVGDRSRNKVFVIGEVLQPQSKLMVKGRMTLAEAINETGGLPPSIANPSQIFVLRGDYDAPSVFRLNAGSADALLLATQFQLKPRDVVFVSTYKVAEWNRVIGQILPTVTGLWTAYDLGVRATNSIRTGNLQ
jgi:polysaccharide biosynthesis/export protein